MYIVTSLLQMQNLLVLLLSLFRQVQVSNDTSLLYHKLVTFSDYGAL